MRARSWFLTFAMLSAVGLATAAAASELECPSGFALDFTASDPFALTAVPAAPPMTSPLALAMAEPESGPLLAASDRSMLGTRKPKAKRTRSMAGGAERHTHGVLSPERARMLLQSLTVPGWGQATAGAHRSAATFLIAEAGVWGSFTAFRIQQQLRRQSYERTAELFAGIDLKDRDEEFRRIVGSFSSSDEYNRLVVRRDAANIFFNDPNGFNPAAYEDYVAKHELHGSDAWSWSGEQEFLRYRSQRADTQRAGLRANTALALAVANRIVSAIHAARLGPRATPPPRTSWNFECLPDAGDPTSFRLAVRATF